MRLLRQLSTMMDTILQSVTHDKDQTVDYVEATKHQLYPMLEEATCELQGVHLDNMGDGTRTVREKRVERISQSHTWTLSHARLCFRRHQAFCINLYNLMIKFSFCKMGAFSNEMNQKQLFDQVCVQVGNDILSLQAIKHGILRGNRKAPWAISAPLGSGDD